MIEVFVLVRKSITFALLFFVLITAWKWISNSEIHWLENIGLSIAVALVNLLVDWAMKTYENKKE